MSSNNMTAGTLSKFKFWKDGRPAASKTSITPYEFQWFRYCLSALVCLSIASACIENGLHPAAAVTLPLIIAALSRRDYRRPFLWSDRAASAIFSTYAVIMLVAVLLLVRRIPLPVLLAYFTFVTILARVLSPLTDRNLAQLVFLTVGLILINCILTNHLIFGIILPLYVFVLMTTLALFDIARSRNAAEVPPGFLDGPPVRKLTRYFGKAALGITALSMAIFVFLPRPFLSVPGLRSSMASTTGPADLDQRISYSEMVNRAGRQRIAFVVDLEGGSFGETPYWRGRVLEVYNGKNWSAGPERVGLPRAVQPALEDTVWYKYTPYNLQSNVIYVYGIPYSVTPDKVRRSLYISSNGEAVVDSAFMTGTSYEVVSSALPLSAHRKQTLPNLSTNGITPRITSLAQEWTRGIDAPAEKAKAIRARLIARYRYSLDTPPPPEGMNPMEYFLFQSKEGHCEYFAGAFCLMLRSLEIPARVVEGFTGMEPTSTPGQFAVRFTNAHAWVEAVLGDKYWTVLDPTPPGGSRFFSRYWAMILDVYDTLVRRWTKYVVYFDRSDQSNIKNMVTDLLESDAFLSDEGSGLGYVPQIVILSIVIFVAAFLIMLRVRHGRKDVPGIYVKTMNGLVAKGVLSEVHPWHELNLRDIARNAPGCSDAALRFTNLYFEARFGDYRANGIRGALAESGEKLLKAADKESLKAEKG